MMCQRPTTFVQEKGDSFSIAQNPTQNVVCVMENDMMRGVKSTGGLKRGAEQSGSYDQPQAHAFEGDNFAQSSESRKGARSRNDGVGPNCGQGCEEVHVPVSIFLPRDLVIVNFKKERGHAAASKASIAVATRGPRESLEPKGKMQLQAESKLTSAVKLSRPMCDRRGKILCICCNFSKTLKSEHKSKQLEGFMAAASSDANTTSSTSIASDNGVLTAAADYAATESTSYAEDDRVLRSKPLGFRTASLPCFRKTASPATTLEEHGCVCTNTAPKIVFRAIRSGQEAGARDDGVDGGDCQGCSEEGEKQPAEGGAIHGDDGKVKMISNGEFKCRKKSLVADFGNVLDKVIKRNDYYEKQMFANVDFSKAKKDGDVEEGERMGCIDGLELFVAKDVCPKSASEYAARMVKYSNCTPACLIVALIYLRRTGVLHFGGGAIATAADGMKDGCTSCGSEQHKRYLTSYTMQRLLITAVMLASKWLERSPTCSSRHWAQIGGISVKEINRLEMLMLKSLNFRCHCSGAEYKATRDAVVAYSRLLQHPKP